MEISASHHSSHSSSGLRLPMIGGDGWRRHGEERRRDLLRKDKAEGGTSFFINRKCHVHKYFQVADRVLDQFRDMYQNRRNMEEIYVMGNRLIAFLSVALPKHPQYQSITPEVSALRDKSLHDLDWIRKRLDVIKLRIDEDQLNRFIAADMGANREAIRGARDRNSKPAPSKSSAGVDVSFEVDDSSLSTEESHWESFSGWTLDASHAEVKGAWNDTINEVSFDSHDIMDVSSSPVESEEEAVEDPGDILDLQSESSDDAESGDDTFDINDEQAVRFTFDEENEIDSTFLKAVASEDVRYETDSEAVDSWAQDSDCSILSLPVSPHVSACDDEQDVERIALEDIMNKVQIVSAMQISPEKKKRVLGIHGNVRQESQAAVMFGDDKPFDEVSTPSPDKKYERLGIRNYPSPDQENRFLNGQIKGVPADHVTFEMKGIAPRRRVRYGSEEEANVLPPSPSMRDLSDTSMYLSDDSESEEELDTRNGAILRPFVYPHYRLR